MAKHGPIVLIEDDTDDKQVFEMMLKDIGVKNPLKWFRNTKEGTEYLNETDEKPFLLFCDINLPGDNGLQFKKSIDENKVIRRKSIPFIFYSTSAQQSTVNEAYLELTIQGFFQKEGDYNENKENIKCIVHYWMRCRHPDLS